MRINGSRPKNCSTAVLEAVNSASPPGTGGSVTQFGSHWSSKTAHSQSKYKARRSPPTNPIANLDHVVQVVIWRPNLLQLTRVVKRIDGQDAALTLVILLPADSVGPKYFVPSDFENGSPAGSRRAIRRTPKLA